MTSNLAKWAIVIMIAARCPFADADDLSSRIAEGRSALSTSAGAAYEQATVSVVRAAMQACIPAGSTDPANLGAFSLVAYVALDGALSQVAVSPETDVSRCFKEHFVAGRLPPPPSHESPKGFPLLVAMTVVQ